MGCSMSKLDDEEAVRICKDRKKFIKQAVEQRLKFASGHIAYIQSMKRVSVALREYIEGDDPREFLPDEFTTPSPTPLKRKNPAFISITPFKSESNSSYRINYYRPSGNPSVSFEERPPRSPETYRVEAYSSAEQFGMDGIFTNHSSSMNSFFHYSPNHRPNHPPSPQTSQWDFFWNPFSSLDYYGYPARSSLDRTFLDENDGLRQVREEEGIPELEEETEHEDIEDKDSIKELRDNVGARFKREEIVVEDVEDSDDSDNDEEDEDDDDDGAGGSSDINKNMQRLQSNEHQSVKVSKTQNVEHISCSETTIANGESKKEKPEFMVYVNRRPTSMAEVIKDLEDQFTAACNAAKEVSSILEASRAQYSSTSNDLTALKMLNPVAIFRSASFRSSSSRFLAISAQSNNDEGCESSSDFSQESCMFRSHQSTLDRLYAWEKKLYQEVRAGERIRIAYEKKCAQLRKQDVKGEDPFSVDKTRAAIRDLHTHIKVSIHSVEAVSKRIETLRDEELEPQILELIQGLARMWEMMAECHQLQKRTLDEAKILLAGTPSKHARTKKYTIMSSSEPHKLACSAANLETELRNWRSCFESWIVSQQSYVRALTSWLFRCIRADPSSLKPPFSPQCSLDSAPPIFNACIQWSKLLDDVHKVPVLDGLDFFAAGIGSVYAQQLKDDSSYRRHSGSYTSYGVENIGNKMEVVEADHFEHEVMTAEKMAEVAIRVLCAGMSVAISSLTEFAVTSAEGYTNLVKQWENSEESIKDSKRTEK